MSGVAVRKPFCKLAIRTLNRQRMDGDILWRTARGKARARRWERQMITAEPSYFDFLMKHRCPRRTRVPFAQAVGVMPELTRVVRLRVSDRGLPAGR